MASQEVDELVIGRAIDRWSRHTDFQRVTVDAYTLCDTRIRLDIDGKDGSVFGVLHYRKIHPR